MRYHSAPSISADTPIKIPLRMWLTIIGCIVASACTITGMYFSIKEEVALHTQDILDLKRSEREQREILIRVDENLKELKRRIP